jgi:hypothetical protein
MTEHKTASDLINAIQVQSDIQQYKNHYYYIVDINSNKTKEFIQNCENKEELIKISDFYKNYKEMALTEMNTLKFKLYTRFFNKIFYKKAQKDFAVSRVWEYQAKKKAMQLK